MRTLVQLLLISTAALTRVMTTKAKIEGMSTQSQNLSDEPDPDPVYGYPWTSDEGEGQCTGTDKFNSFETKEGVTFGQCMLFIKDHGTCIMPVVPYDDNLEGKVFLHSDKIWYCVAECSMEGHKCPSGSTCMPIPKDMTVPGFDISTKPEDAKNICFYQKPPYEKPSFEKKGKECHGTAGFQTTNFIGLDYGSCNPTVKNDKCPDAHNGCKQTPQVSGEKNGIKTCELPCNEQPDCSNETICVPKKKQKLFGIQLQSATFTGSCLYPSSHHDFEDPHAKDKYQAQCKEDAGGDVVQLDRTDGTKASICAPQATDGKCQTPDHPDGYNKLPIAIKDKTGTHCQLSCDSDDDCPMKDSKCQSIKNSGQETKICLYQDPLFYEIPSFEKKILQCLKYEDYKTTKYLGLNYGACYPTVAASVTCPEAPTGYKHPSQQSGEKSKNKLKIRCELPCNVQADCGGASKCVPKPSPKPPSMLSQAPFTGVCLILDPSPENHHDYSEPKTDDEGKTFTCTENATDNGVDLVELETKDPQQLAKKESNKARICAPKLPLYGECPPKDVPTGQKSKPIAIKDHCQLPCQVDIDCPGQAKCLTLKDDSNNSKICLYGGSGSDINPPVPDKKSIVMYIVIGVIVVQVLVGVFIVIKCYCCKKAPEPEVTDENTPRVNATLTIINGEKDNTEPQLTNQPRVGVDKQEYVNQPSRNEKPKQHKPNPSGTNQMTDSAMKFDKQFDHQKLGAKPEHMPAQTSMINHAHVKRVEDKADETQKGVARDDHLDVLASIKRNIKLQTQQGENKKVDNVGSNMTFGINNQRKDSVLGNAQEVDVVDVDPVNKSPELGILGKIAADMNKKSQICQCTNRSGQEATKYWSCIALN